MECGWARRDFLLHGVRAGSKIAELQARFDHETNPVHRAKLLEKLGDAQFEETRRAFKANDLVTVGVVLEKYRDNARIALEGLKKKHADAERDANGYRQLEIHVRRGIREVDEILLRIPEHSSRHCKLFAAIWTPWIARLIRHALSASARSDGSIGIATCHRRRD